MNQQNKNLPPRLAQWLVSKLSVYEHRFSLAGDLRETFEYMTEADGVKKAKLWYWSQALKSVFLYVHLIIRGNVAMLKNYVTVAIRNFIEHKLFSFINVSGLAIGLAACLIIRFWVQRELSYDRFHENSDRIYRVERELFRDKLYSRWPICGGSYKQALIDDYPEIENAVRIWRREFSIKDQNNHVHRQGMFAVDNSIFEIFDFGLEAGDELSALTKPRTVVLTRESALKYFDTEDVIGKSLAFEWNNEPVDFEITGILRKVPENSHIHFDMLMSISSYPDTQFSSWRSNYLYTYILVTKNTSRSNLEEKLKAFVNQRLEPYYGDLLSQGLDIHEVLKMHIFPLTDIHLNPGENWEIEAGGNKSSVYIFSSIAVLILFIAGVNFVNLSTARANKRAKEVSLRKTVGAGLIQLRVQFIQESVLLAGIAMLLALVLVALFIPAYNSILGEMLSMNLFLQAQTIMILIGITLTVGIFAGIYPAFYLTKFEPAHVLKGGLLSGTGKSAFRTNMAVIQFIISISLIIGMFTVYTQMKYIQTRSLGFDKENVVILPVRSRQVGQSYQAFRNELLQSSQIMSLSASSDIPSDTYISNTGFANRQNPDDNINLFIMTTDYDFLDTYRMEVLTGRKYSKEFSADTAGAIMLNEAAVQRIGWTAEEAVAKKLDRGDANNSANIVGVVKNFNFKSLRSEVEPLVLVLYPDYINEISIRIQPGDVGKTLDFIEQKWTETFSGEQFEYSFLDNRINQLYENEKRMQNIFIVFACLSISVACLGLFGLAAFMAEERTKEIGVRKVLGASSANILTLLSKEFIKVITVAFVVAVPISYYIMNNWLQNFAYRVNLEMWLFILPGILALVIALLSVSFQSLKAARAKPVSALKYE